MTRTKIPRKPTYLNSHPPELATADALRAEGLKPAEGQRPAALFKQKTAQRESLSGLFERAGAVPSEPQTS